MILVKFSFVFLLLLVSPKGPVKIVDFLPFLFLSIAACSAAILSFSSADTSVEGATGKG